MITNKTICKIWNCLTFLLWQFLLWQFATLVFCVAVVFVIFVGILFVFFDTLSITIIISSYSVIEVSLDSNYNLFCTYDNFYIHINMFYYSIFWFELHVVLINFHLQSHEICSVIALASLLFVIILHSLTFLPDAQRRRDVSVRSHISRDVADHAETLLRRRNKYVNETDLLETSLRRLIST